MTTNLAFGEQFKQRTKKFTLSAISVYQSLPPGEEARIIGKQLLRSSTATAANYRAACRARSTAEFYAKLCIVVEEADESLFWLELLEEAGIVPSLQLAPLKKEANEIVSILIKARSSLKKNLSKKS